MASSNSQGDGWNDESITGLSHLKETPALKQLKNDWGKSKVLKPQFQQGMLDQSRPQPLAQVGISGRLYLLQTRYYFLNELMLS